jgi:thiamine pyrophosphokinase
MLSLGPAGAIVSVLPLSRRARARSIGLEWPLGGLVLGPMSSRGLSNLIAHAPAAIEWESGELLVVSERCENCEPARET